jgi:hypothetical protein
LQSKLIPTRYYVIQSGDFCGKIENQFGISFTQLQFWNPSLLADCSNLLLGEAYCVNGVTQPASNAAATTGTVAAKAKRTAAPTLEGGVPYGWPGLNAREWRGGSGAALKEL